MTTPTPAGAEGPEELGTPPEEPGTAAEAPGPTATDPVAVDPATERRAPRPGRFVLAGVLAGALLSVLLALLPIGSSDLGAGTVFLLLFLALGFLGGLLGAVTALVADRRSLRRRTRPPAR